ncbi:MAG: glycoside hydrolase family 30 beta sandwich domain-containing protein, partial [Faecousia sp.]
DLIGNLNEGMGVFLDWNLILNEVGGPNHVGNYCDAPFLLHTGEGKLMRSEIQHYLEHFSRYITPGSIRIGFSRYTDKIELTAFQTGESIVVVFLNRTDEALPAYLRVYNQCVQITLAPRSISTGLVTN